MSSQDTADIVRVIAAELRREAPDEATSSRDFGRGYMHAVRLLEAVAERFS